MSRACSPINHATLQDSSKNLRVRALLNHFLPPTTRSLVTTEGDAFGPIVKFTAWIQARYDCIDGGVKDFLTSSVYLDSKTGTAQECNILLFGAGHDTRALRYRHAHERRINFIEVDPFPFLLSLLTLLGNNWNLSLIHISEPTRPY